MDKTRYSIVAAVFISGFFAQTAWSTDLVTGGLVGPSYFFYDEPQSIQFEIRNENILTANEYLSTITIENLQDQVVFETEVEGRDLKPFTNETVTAPIQWLPELTGKYRLSIGVDFAFDIDTSNNSMTTDIVAIIDYNEAADRLVHFLPEIGACDPNNAAIFMPREPLGPGDTISNDTEIETYSISLSLNSYKWFAYLDCDPGAKYSHPGALVTIDGLDGSINYASINTWAVINDEAYMADPWSRLETDDQIYGSLPPVETVDSFSTIREETVSSKPPGKTCAILVSGRIREEWERAAFNFDLDLMEGNLTRESLGLQLNPANIERIGNATAGEICDAIDRARIGYDKIIFYYGGHGYRGSMVTNDPGSHQLSYLALADKLYDTEAKDICVIIDACYAGSAEGRFRIPYEFTQKNVTLIAASMSTKTSLARVIQTNADGEKVWASFFTWHFAQCYGDPDAESDGQAGISFVEAFNWVREQNPRAIGGTINQLQNPVLVVNRAENP